VTSLSDWRFHTRCAALLALLIALVLPPIKIDRRVFDVIAMLDITGSMNVVDQQLDGYKVSRIAMEKRAVRRLLAALPCGSRLGLGVFVEKQPFLLFEPVETCGNFAALDAEIAEVDWRMGWDSESHIAETLRAAMVQAASLGADLIFMTDGQETPPLSWDGAPDFNRARGGTHGLIVGVGGRELSPIPKFDAYGRQVGYFRPGDVPSETGGMFRGREHLSAVDEPHLRALAAESGLAYLHLQGEGALLPALLENTRPRLHAGDLPLAWAPATLALLLILAASLPLGGGLHPSRRDKAAGNNAG
jgi:mxaL protein